MLSRSAQNLYWLGRYLERAEHLCRLLQLQMETLVDRPRQEIHFGWQRIYANLQRRPPLAKAEFELYRDDDSMLADAYTLADDLTFETSNPDSLHSCFAHGRENARQSRNCLSFEMWTCLNRTWLQLKEVDLAKIWQPTPENFYARTTEQLAAFAGITAATMYRTQGWHFLQLGRAIERAKQTSSLLLAQQKLSHPQKNFDSADWLSLLRFYQALDTYQWNYRGHIDPPQVLRLLVHDRRLPCSLAHTLLHVNAKIDALVTDTATKDRDLQQFSTRLEKKSCPPKTTKNTKPFNLAECHEQLYQLDRLITARWFDYSIEDCPAAP